MAPQVVGGSLALLAHCDNPAEDTGPFILARRLADAAL